MNTLNSGSFWLVSFSPSLLFSLKETRLSPGSIFECWASLGNHGFIPVSNPCYFFFAVHTRCRHRFTLECHNPMLFLLPGYASQNYSHSQSPVPITDNFFFKKGYRGHYRECWRHESPRGSGVQLNLGAPKRYFQHLSWDMSAENRPRRSVTHLKLKCNVTKENL